MLYKYLSGKVNLSIYYLQIQIEISHKICTCTQRNHPKKNELINMPYLQPKKKSRSNLPCDFEDSGVL